MNFLYVASKFVLIILLKTVTKESPQPHQTPSGRTPIHTIQIYSFADSTLERSGKVFIEVSDSLGKATVLTTPWLRVEGQDTLFVGVLE